MDKTPPFKRSTFETIDGHVYITVQGDSMTFKDASEDGSHGAGITIKEIDLVSVLRAQGWNIIDHKPVNY